MQSVAKKTSYDPHPVLFTVRKRNSDHTSNMYDEGYEARVFQKKIRKRTTLGSSNSQGVSEAKFSNLKD